MRQKTLLLTFMLVLMGSSSCRTIQPSRPTRHILVAVESPSSEVSIPSLREIEIIELAQQLSKDVGMPLTQIDNLGLYAFVADWKNVPYRFGSYSKKGTDCSGFVFNLYKEVYDINIKRSSAADYMRQSNRINKDKLQEGDMVFFCINNRRGKGRASHVGIYLRDGLFVHATTRTGVTISSLNDPYYKRTYIGAGRIKDLTQKDESDGEA